MTFLADLFTATDLESALRNGLVVERRHQAAPLCILNYTERCQYERGNWNAVTTQCRGLIYEYGTGRVVARPFRKFFNWGQAEAPQVDLSTPVEVTDKLDGSLGILYPVGEGHAIATRGSFDSEQARHGTALWRERYAGFRPHPGLTLLFEIVYPDNRIVVDYAGTDDLFLLGAVDIATGRSVSVNSPLLGNWEGPVATTFHRPTLGEALEIPPRPNAEGLVIHLVGADERVKVKQEDYVALHRIVTGLNERTVWEHLSAGKALGELLTALPDEFHDWTKGIANALTDRIDWEGAEIERDYADIMAHLPEGWTRKDFALRAMEHPMRSMLFARLDGKDYKPQLWKNAKPEPRRGPRGIAFNEAAA